MTDAMYQFSVPVFVRHFEILKTILDIALKNAASRKIDPSVFFNARLAPDMLPLHRQIQLASDSAKGCAARLGDTTVPSYADDETSFEDLFARIDKTLDFIKSIPSERFAGSAERTIQLRLPSRELTFSGRDYLQTFAIPNFYFHITTAYAILRAQGVPLGKQDYLGKPNNSGN